MNWRIKALTFKSLSLLPGADSIADFYRTRFGKMAHFDVSKRFNLSAPTLDMIGRAGVNLPTARCLEIGAGWQPTIPVMLYLAGARNLTLTDIKRSLTDRTVPDAMRQYLSHSEQLAQIVGGSPDDIRRDLHRLSGSDTNNWQSVFESSGIHYIAPLDLSIETPPGGPFDLIYSHSVLSFIPKPILQQIIQHSRTMMKTGGICCHNITVADEFHGCDPNITHANFLRFSEKQWQFWGQSRLKHQNRLRPSDYVRMFEEAGFSIVECDIEPDSELIPRLAELNIHADFKGCPPIELAAIHCRLIARAKS